MELLLNLIWLLLVVPAYLLWNESRQRPGIHRSGFTFLALICVLALLFPVVSATDDLQAMRPEIEEAGSRDALSSPHHHRFASIDHPVGSVALPSLSAVRHEYGTWGLVAPVPPTLPAAHVVPTRAGRGPPRSFLG